MKKLMTLLSFLAIFNSANSQPNTFPYNQELNVSYELKPHPWIIGKENVSLNYKEGFAESSVSIPLRTSILKDINIEVSTDFTRNRSFENGKLLDIPQNSSVCLNVYLIT